MKVVFGSRGSDLALTQTRTVMARLAEVCPALEIELRIIKTTGDNKPEARLEDIGGLGAFTREIEVALLEGEIDVAVHSLKDLPTKQPEGLVVAAVAGRESPNDVLITQEGIALTELKKGALVGTSSLRRQSQLLALRPDLEIRELRGNVPTRMGRVVGGDLDAVILAAAGLNRLGLGKEKGVWKIPVSMMLPAPGQGALALETRSTDAPLQQLLALLHDGVAAAAVNCERAALQAFGGGCRAPLGVYAQVRDASIYVQGFAANMEAGQTATLSREGAVTDAISLGEAVGRILHESVYSSNEAPYQKTMVPRVVVTRPTHQAGSFGAKLAQAGAAVLHCPLIDVKHTAHVELPDADQPFDWLIFTSANGVNSFQYALQQAGREIREYKGLRIAAIGAATTSAIESFGLHVECMPERHVADALVEALLQAEPEPAGKRVLFPQGNLARPVVAAGLAAHGMDVSSFVVYETVERHLSGKDIDMVTGFAPHVISFFSPSAVRAYIASGIRERLAASETPVRYASIGPVTSEALRKASCVPIIEAHRQSEESLCDVIVDACLP